MSISKYDYKNDKFLDHYLCEGYSKSEILRKIINEFKLDRNLESRSWPKWLSEI